MGVVYKARDPEIGRLVAIKTLKSVFLSEDAVGQEALQRFRQESRSAGRLHHPNIVTIFEAGRAQNGSPYIVMEYIEGKSLEAILREEGALEPLQAFHYLAQIANAIDYALSQNIIHRDIKPSNIIIDQFHRPFLLDFGVAKLSDTSLTPAGTVVGTPSYMSPEQIRGENLDGRSDLFSFAVVTYEVLTGRRPFPGTDFATVVANILQKSPLAFAEVSCTLPSYLESVLNQGLSREREQRFPTATALIDAAAQTLGISVDNTGLIGGYRQGMKLSELASQQTGGRVRAPTLLQGMPSGGEFGGLRPSADPITSLNPVFPSSFSNSATSEKSGVSESQSGSENLASSENQAGSGGDLGSRNGPIASIGTGLGQSSLDDSAEGGETKLITAGQKLFQQAAIESQKRSAPVFTESKSAAARRREFEEEEDLSQEPASKLPLFLAFLAFAAILGGGVWFFLSQGRSDGNSGEQNGSETDSSEISSSSSGAVNPNGEASPQPTPSVKSETPVKTATPSSSVPANLSNSSDELPDEPPPPSEPGFLPVKPANMPPGGFTASGLKELKDEEIAWLLSEHQQDSKLLRLLIAEVGTRKSSELLLRLMPVSMHQDYTVRIDVIKSLSRSEFRSNPEVMAVIIAALSDSEFLVRGFAAKTLAAIGSPEAVKALQAREGEEKNQVVLKVIQDSLASLRK